MTAQVANVCLSVLEPETTQLDTSITCKHGVHFCIKWKC